MGPPIGAAELIVLPWGDLHAILIVKEIVGIEGGVLQKLEQAAVILIGAGLSYHVDYRVSSEAHLGGVQVFCCTLNSWTASTDGV